MPDLGTRQAESERVGNDRRGVQAYRERLVPSFHESWVKDSAPPIHWTVTVPRMAPVVAVAWMLQKY